jgi:cell division septal protein FtsQ
MSGAAQPTGKRVTMSMLLLATLGAVVVAGLLGAQAWKQDLRVARVRVQGNRIVPTSAVLELAGVPRGAKLFDLDLTAIHQRVKKNPFVGDVVVQRNLPEGVDIQIVEREPIAVLSVGTLYYIDADGMVLPLVRSDEVLDLPVVTGDVPAQECTPGKTMRRASVHEALRLLTTAQELSEGLPRRISEVHVRPDGDLIVYTAEFGVPVVFGQGDLAPKLVKLEAFWKEIVSNRGALELASLDVRFQDRVIARWAAENKTEEQ